MLQCTLGTLPYRAPRLHRLVRWSWRCCGHRGCPMPTLINSGRGGKATTRCDGSDQLSPYSLQPMLLHTSTKAMQQRLVVCGLRVLRHHPTSAPVALTLMCPLPYLSLSTFHTALYTLYPAVAPHGLLHSGLADDDCIIWIHVVCHGDSYNFYVFMCASDSTARCTGCSPALHSSAPASSSAADPRTPGRLRTLRCEPCSVGNARRLSRAARRPQRQRHTGPRRERLRTVACASAHHRECASARRGRNDCYPMIPADWDRGPERSLCPGPPRRAVHTATPTVSLVLASLPPARLRVRVCGSRGERAAAGAAAPPVQGHSRECMIAAVLVPGWGTGSGIRLSRQERNAWYRVHRADGHPCHSLGAQPPSGLGYGVTPRVLLHGPRWVR